MILPRAHFFNGWSKLLCSSYGFLLLLIGLVGCTRPNEEILQWESNQDFYCWPDASCALTDEGLEITQVSSESICRWLTKYYDESTLSFTTSVEVNLRNKAAAGEGSWVGFTFGLAGDKEKTDPGLPVGVTTNGRVFVGKSDEYNSCVLPDEFRLEVRGMKARDKRYYLFLEIFRPSGRMIGQRIVPVDPSWLVGYSALTVSNQASISLIPWAPKPMGLPMQEYASNDEGWGAVFDSWVAYGDRFEMSAEASGEAQ
ncbi:MAG: hypothetical protein AAFP08_04130 [Bacteroidota bacterium]